MALFLSALGASPRAAELRSDATVGAEAKTQDPKVLHARICIYIYIFILQCTCVYTYIYIYIYNSICIYVYTHMYDRLFSSCTNEVVFHDFLVYSKG